MPVSAVRAESYDPAVVRAALRKAFDLLGLDPANPFKDIVRPGNRVFLKPNWVAHRYRASCPRQHDVYTTITHPEVIRAVAEAVDVALDGRGQILIGDNPSIDADFSELMKLQALDSLKTRLKTPVDFLDLRPLVCRDLRDYGNRDKMHERPGDPAGQTVVNLGRDSMLHGMNPRLFRGVFDQRDETIRAHSGDTHLYGISNSIFQSDVFISIPKLKAHHKCGVTLNLKGLVGTMGTKNYLVHWREGFPAIGGDAYPSFRAWFSDLFRKVKNRGAWAGNDTIWRMVVDLHAAIRQGPPRRFTVIDGILGGEGNGPFCPEPKPAQTLLAGTEFLDADLVAARLMGFDVRQIPYLDHYIARGDITPEAIPFASDFMDPASLFNPALAHLDFKPPTAWKNLRIAGAKTP
jgi:uncharacterized protein (DUF362 family)